MEEIEYGIWILEGGDRREAQRQPYFPPTKRPSTRICAATIHERRAGYNVALYSTGLSSNLTSELTKHGDLESGISHSHQSNLSLEAK